MTKATDRRVARQKRYIAASKPKIDPDNESDDLSPAEQVFRDIKKYGLRALLEELPPSDPIPHQFKGDAMMDAVREEVRDPPPPPEPVPPPPPRELQWWEENCGRPPGIVDDDDARSLPETIHDYDPLERAIQELDDLP